MKKDVRKKMIDDYIEKYHLPNAKIIDCHNKKYFDTYSLYDIPKESFLADYVYKDRNGEMKYGFLKGVNKEEMKMIIGDTRSGKTLRYLVSQITCCAVQGISMIITDQTGEIPNYTFSFLKDNNYNIKIINLLDTTKSDTYNPFYLEAKRNYINGKKMPGTTGFLNEIASALISSDTREPTWGNGSRHVISGIEHNMFSSMIKGHIKPEDITIYNLVEQYHWLESNIVSNGSSCTNLFNLEYYRDLDIMDEGVKLMISQVSAGGVTRSGFFSTINSDLATISNDYTYNITSTSSINVTELWEKPTVIFVVTGGKKIGDIISKMLISELNKEIEEYTSAKLDKKLPIPIELFLDEFPHINFGDKQQIKTMIETMGKHNVFLNLFVQNDNQLFEIYGEYGGLSMEANLTQVFLGTKDYITRENISKAIGNHTYESLESIYSGGCPVLKTSPLVPPEELKEMETGTAYILRKGSNKSNLLTYFEGAYNNPYLHRSNDYLNELAASQYDYKANVVVQPMMIPNTDKEVVINMNKNDLFSHIGADFDEYEDYLYGKIKLDPIQTKKYLKKGLVYIDKKMVLNEYTGIFS